MVAFKYHWLMIFVIVCVECVLVCTSLLWLLFARLRAFMLLAEGGLGVYFLTFSALV